MTGRELEIRRRAEEAQVAKDLGVSQGAAYLLMARARMAGEGKPQTELSKEVFVGE